MAEPLSDQVMRQLAQSAGLYYRLTLVVATRGIGKTAALQDVATRTGVPVINVNLELSRRMLDLTARQRALQVPQLLEEIAAPTGGELTLLDNLEILFDVTLQQDPLRLLQRLSRQHIVVAAWNGSIAHGYMTYAVPGHVEYRRYPIQDFLVVSAEATA